MNNFFVAFIRLLIDFYGVGWAYTTYLTKQFFSFDFFSGLMSQVSTLESTASDLTQGLK